MKKIISASMVLAAATILTSCASDAANTEAIKSASCTKLS